MEEIIGQIYEWVCDPAKYLTNQKACETKIMDMIIKRNMSEEMINMSQLLRETVMRCRIVFPENEQDEVWWKSGTNHNTSWGRDYMNRLDKALKVSNKSARDKYFDFINDNH